MQPPIIVCLGATAAQDLLGPQFRLSPGIAARSFLPKYGPITATIQPSRDSSYA